MAIAPACVLADQFFINPEGERQLAEIRKELGSDTSLLKTPPGRGFSSKHFFRGSVVAIKPPADLKAKWNTKEGSALLRIKQFPGEAGSRPPDVELPEAWLEVTHEMDSFLDLRMYCSNRDKLHSTRIGSARFSTLFLQSVDPGGSLGLAAPASDPITEGLREGVYAKRLRAWGNRRFSTNPMGGSPETMRLVQEFYKDMAAKGHSRMWLALNSPVDPMLTTDAYGWIDTIARARRYQIYEPGLERALFSVLGTRLRLARCRTGDDYSKFVKYHGYGVREAIRQTCDIHHIATAKRLREDREALQGFPVSGSEIIDVGLDLATAYYEVLIPFMDAETAEKRLESCIFHTGYKPVDSERFFVPPDFDEFPEVLSTDLPSIPPVVRLDQLLSLVSNPPSQEKDQPVPLRQKALNLIAVLVRGDFGDIEERHLPSAELARYEAIEDITAYMKGMTRASVEDEGSPETIEERLSRSYGTWRALLGILQGAEWPGRSEAYVEEIAGYIFSAMSGHADTCWDAGERGDKDAVLLGRMQLDHCIRMLLDLEQLPSDHATAEFMIEEVTEWKATYSEAWKNNTLSETEKVKYQRYLEVSK